MKLRARAWKIIWWATGGLLVGVMLVGGFLFTRSVRSLEKAETMQQAEHARAMVAIELEDLERLARDYAERSYPAVVAQGRMPGFPDANWTASTLANVRIEGWLVFGRDGAPVGGTELPPGSAAVKSARAEVLTAFLPEVRSVLADERGRTRVRGFKRVAGALMAFAASPVKASAGDQAPRGAMIGFRRVDEAFVTRLQRLIERPLEIVPVEAESASFESTALADVRLAIVSWQEMRARVALRGADGELLGWLQLGLDRPFHRQEGWMWVMFSGLVLASALLFGGLTQILLRRLVVTRLEALHEGLARVRSGDFSVRLPVSGRDEIGELGCSLNAMLSAIERGRRERERAQQEREALQDHLARAQRMEVVGEIARGIAHDFNNCLTVIAGWIGLVRETLPEGDENRQLLGNALVSTDHAVDVVRQLLLYSRQSAPVLEAVRLHEMIDGSVKLLRSAVPKAVTIEVRANVADDAVLGDRTQLVQVLVNLVKNAADAMHGAGRVAIHLDVLRLPDPACVGSEGLLPRDYLRLTVKDNGPGIPPDVRARIFEPFFTTKATGRGTGLGLAVVSSVVSRHGGAVGVESTPGEGATFRVYLPRHLAKVAPGERVADPAEGVKGARILVAEDDLQVSQVVATILRRHGAHVVTQPDGHAAWQAFQNEEPPFDLVLTDLNMPRMSGVQLGERIFDSPRRVPVILMSAYAATLDAAKLQRVGFVAVIGKPLVMPDLLSSIARARLSAAGVASDGPRSLL